MDIARVGGLDDVGDHIEDGDCVPTCVFTALDMDIAKVGGVEVGDDMVPVSQPGCNAALDVDTAKVSVHEGCW